jgi:hypothetical protein
VSIAGIRRRRNEQSWRPHLAQPVIAFKTGGASMQDGHWVATILTNGSPKLARSRDHLQGSLAEELFEFVNRREPARAVQRPLCGPENSAAAVRLTQP